MNEIDKEEFQIDEGMEQLTFFKEMDKVKVRKMARRHTQTEFKLRKVRELAIFTQAKKTLSYIFVCTKNAPKSYRWSIIEKLHNSAISMLELIYLANEINDASRLEYQRQAMAKLKLTATFADICQSFNIITKQQFATLSMHLYDTKKLLWGWTKCSIN